MVIPKFGNASSAQSVHAELKARVNNYFQQKGIETTGTFPLHAKAVIMVAAYTAIYVHLVFFTPSNLFALLECIGLGILTAGIGFNVMHDGAHGSFSKHKLVNEMASYTLDMLGASSFMWNTKHNIVHHAYTNIHGVDDDIEAGALLRMCEDQKYHRIHKYQHRYFLVFILAIVFCLGIL